MAGSAPILNVISTHPPRASYHHLSGSSRPLNPEVSRSSILLAGSKFLNFKGINGQYVREVVYKANKYLLYIADQEEGRLRHATENLKIPWLKCNLNVSHMSWSLISTILYSVFNLYLFPGNLYRISALGTTIYIRALAQFHKYYVKELRAE